jgi:hypothetical protein
LCGINTIDSTKGRVACHNTSVPCRNSKISFNDLRIIDANFNYYKCPDGYSNDTTNIRLDDRTLLYDSSNGHSIVNARCGAKKHRSLRGCKRNVYDNDDELAKCYTNNQDKTIYSQFINTENRDKYLTGISKFGNCPRDYNNPEAKDKFLSNYCTKNLYNATSNPYCTEWWGGRKNKQTQDDVVIGLCTKPENRNHPSCACINAPNLNGVQNAVKWAYHEPCLLNGYRTRYMDNLTIQDCRSYINANEIDTSMIGEMVVYQTCTQNASNRDELANTGSSSVDASNANTGITTGGNTGTRNPTTGTSNNTKEYQDRLDKIIQDRMDEQNQSSKNTEKSEDNSNDNEDKTTDPAAENQLKLLKIVLFIIFCFMFAYFARLILIKTDKSKNSTQNTEVN